MVVPSGRFHSVCDGKKSPTPGNRSGKFKRLVHVSVSQRFPGGSRVDRGTDIPAFADDNIQSPHQLIFGVRFQDVTSRPAWNALRTNSPEECRVSIRTLVSGSTS